MGSIATFMTEYFTIETIISKILPTISFLFGIWQLIRMHRTKVLISNAAWMMCERSQGFLTRIHEAVEAKDGTIDRRWLREYQDFNHMLVQQLGTMNSIFAKGWIELQNPAIQRHWRLRMGLVTRFWPIWILTLVKKLKKK
jgi:hypothetical protein